MKVCVTAKLSLSESTMQYRLSVIEQVYDIWGI